MGTGMTKAALTYSKCYGGRERNVVEMINVTKTYLKLDKVT